MPDGTPCQPAPSPSGTSTAVCQPSPPSDPAPGTRSSRWATTSTGDQTAGASSTGLIELGRRCRLVPLLGNHDQMLLEARAGIYPTTWLGMGGIATLDSYGPERDIALIPDEHFDFLESCLDYFETDTHILVHGNYYPDLPMDEQPVSNLRWESLRDKTPGPHESGKTVIVGHTSKRSGEILDLGHLRCIDTYCYGGGWLAAMDVRTEEVWQAVRDGNMRKV